MNIIIYTVLILAGLYFLLRYFTKVASKNISKGLRILLFLILAVFAVLFAIGGKILLTLHRQKQMLGKVQETSSSRA